ncbi:MAG: DUF1961 family protein [Planctomycetota bacterium]|nr:DUF1961 family protein [Planctomycetota bacterium]
MTQWNALVSSESWREVFDEPCTGQWQNHWFLDGVDSKVENTPDGMVLTAGPLPQNDHSMVLWTRGSFAGDIRIEYDYTRLDDSERYVNILYIQATGKGEAPFGKDIAGWSELRQKPSMNLYYENMNLLHISYAVNRFDVEGEYVRTRRYPMKPGGDFGKDTEVEGTYFDTGLFKPDVTYHFTVIKEGASLHFHVTGDGQDRHFQWDFSNFPPVTEGRIGLRQMMTRKAKYKDFRIWIKD